MGLTPLPPGEIAAVVTYLELRIRPAKRPFSASRFELERWPSAGLVRYRALFRHVGAPWLWFSRLVMDDTALAAVIQDPAVEVFAVMLGDEEAGLLELDLRTPGECALAYVALTPEHVGKGHGGWLLTKALDLAWRPGIERVHLQTCTLDHPAALPAYLAAGFVVTGRAIETFADPRLNGLLDPADAPQVKVLAAPADNLR